MPELSWTTALAWVAVLTSALPASGLVGVLVYAWRLRRARGGRALNGSEP